MDRTPFSDTKDKQQNKKLPPQKILTPRNSDSFEVQNHSIRLYPFNVNNRAEKQVWQGGTEENAFKIKQDYTAAMVLQNKKGKNLSVESQRKK